MDATQFQTTRLQNKMLEGLVCRFTRPAGSRKKARSRACSGTARRTLRIVCIGTARRATVRARALTNPPHTHATHTHATHTHMRSVGTRACPVQGARPHPHGVEPKACTFDNEAEWACAGVARRDKCGPGRVGFETAAFIRPSLRFQGLRSPLCPKPTTSRRHTSSCAMVHVGSREKRGYYVNSFCNSAKTESRPSFNPTGSTPFDPHATPQYVQA